MSKEKFVLKKINETIEKHLKDDRMINPISLHHLINQWNSEYKENEQVEEKEEMTVHALKNNDELFLSMSSGLTSNWFEASKFPEEEIEQRKKYVDDEFKVISYQLKELPWKF